MNCFYTYTSCILLCLEIFLLLLSNSRKCHIPFSCLHKYLHRVPGQEHLTTSSIPAEANSLNEAWILCFKIKFDILCKHTVSFITDSFLPKEVYNIKRKLSVSFPIHLNGCCTTPLKFSFAIFAHRPRNVTLAVKTKWLIALELQKKWHHYSDWPKQSCRRTFFPPLL